MLKQDNAEMALFRLSLHRFLDQEVAPHYETWEDQGILPRSLWSAMGDAGFLCVDAPEEYGGCGGDFGLSALVVDVLSLRGGAALTTNVSLHSDIVTPYITDLSNEKQKQYWLPKLVSGEAVGAIAMTEPGAGSDLQGIRWSAKSRGWLQRQWAKNLHYKWSACGCMHHSGQNRSKCRSPRHQLVSIR